MQMVPIIIFLSWKSVALGEKKAPWYKTRARQLMQMAIISVDIHVKILNKMAGFFCFSSLGWHFIFLCLWFLMALEAQFCGILCCYRKASTHDVLKLFSRKPALASWEQMMVEASLWDKASDSCAESLIWGYGMSSKHSSLFSAAP